MESDAEFVERVAPIYASVPGSDFTRLFALARRGAAADAEIERLRAALRDVMVGGNHLATVLGIGHLAAGSSHEAALDFYGPGPNYDVWCCWNAIMQARAALEDK